MTPKSKAQSVDRSPIGLHKSTETVRAIMPLVSASRAQVPTRTHSHVHGIYVGSAGEKR